jgi:hypothetical protein
VNPHGVLAPWLYAPNRGSLLGGGQEGWFGFGDSPGELTAGSRDRRLTAASRVRSSRPWRRSSAVSSTWRPVLSRSWLCTECSTKSSRISSGAVRVRRCASWAGTGTARCRSPGSTARQQASRTRRPTTAVRAVGTSPDQRVTPQIVARITPGSARVPFLINVWHQPCRTADQARVRRSAISHIP